jgi:hypothetical protein
METTRHWMRTFIYCENKKDKFNLLQLFESGYSPVKFILDKKEHLQDPYSFRCAPQVHGASRDVIAYALNIASLEINAVTDNPLVIDEGGSVKIVSGGNFHAQPLALTADFLTIALAEYGSIRKEELICCCPVSAACLLH